MSNKSVTKTNNQKLLASSLLLIKKILKQAERKAKYSTQKPKQKQI